MQRIMHEEFAFANLDDPAAQTGDVIDRALESAVVGADDVRVTQAHCDAGFVFHRRVHRAGDLLLIPRGREIGFLRTDSDGRNQNRQGRRTSRTAEGV